MNMQISKITDKFNPYFEEDFNRFVENYCAEHARKASEMSTDEFEIMCSLFDYEKRIQKNNS